MRYTINICQERAVDLNMSNSAERQTNQSSLRLLRIMECLAAQRTPMRVQEIAKKVNMTQATVSRYLYALQDAKYIYQDSETSRYALTWRVCHLSENLQSFLSLRNITTPFINNLANSLSLGVCLVVNQNNECMYLDCIDKPNSPALQRIGKQAPLHATGSGKVLLSQYNDFQLNEYISNTELKKYTKYTITEPDELRKELDKVRRQGFGMDEQECELGLRCISMPLHDYSGNIIASVSIFGNLDDMNDQRIHAEICPLLKKATDVISSRLGFDR